jgi:phasin family protein
MEKVYADFVAFNQENFDAFVKSSTTFAKGIEQVTKHVAELTQKSIEDAVELGKKFATLKNVNDVVALQTKLIEDGFQSAIEESKKVADLSATVIKETTAPIAERVKASVVAINAAAANVQANVQKAANPSKKAA